MDEAEELILKKIPHTQAYAQIAEKSQHGVSGRMIPGFDKTIQDCARREAHEEVGLNPSDESIHFITMHDDNAAVGLYLIDARSKHPSPPALRPDGVEIVHAEWGRIEAFEIKNVDGLIKVYHPYYDDNGNEFPVEVPLKYALIIGKGIHLSRKMEIELVSKNPEGLSLFTESKNVEAQIIRILKSKRLNPDNLTITDILGKNPEMHLKNIGCSEEKNIPALAQLGKSADLYHTKIRCFAHFFSTAPADKIFSAGDLAKAVHGFSEISQNMASSKVHSFLKMK
jgi:hypothetical protein